MTVRMVEPQPGGRKHHITSCPTCLDDLSPDSCYSHRKVVTDFSHFILRDSMYETDIIHNGVVTWVTTWKTVLIRQKAAKWYML